MHGVLVTETDRLVWAELPTPEPGPGEVRVRVHASGVNRADLVQRAGHYPPPPGVTDVLGLEAAGEIEAIGPGVDGWDVGQRVMCLLAGGGHATHVVCPAGHLMPVPAGWSFTDAAAIPEVLTTAWLNLVREGGLRAGSRVLLHAGASGVGTAAIQVTRAFGGQCWVVVGSAAKLAACEALGARGGVDRHQARFSDHVARWTEGEGFDIVLDPVGGSALDDNLRALATGGRLVVIGLLGGRTGTLDLGRLLVKRLRVIGSVLRSRSNDEKTEILAAMQASLAPHLASGAVRPIVDRVLPIGEIEHAFEILASNETIGKIVLTIA